MCSLMLTLAACGGGEGNEPYQPEPPQPPTGHEPQAPVYESRPNTTILTLKELCWRDGNDDYADSVANLRGALHPVISGVVTSVGDDRLILADSTAAVTIKTKSISLTPGSRVTIDVSRLPMGRSGSMFSLGLVGEKELSDRLTSLGEAPIDTFTIFLSDLAALAANLRQMQSRLVRVNHLKISGHTMTDKSGLTIGLHPEGSSRFPGDTLPVGNFDMVGILSTTPDSDGLPKWLIEPRSTSDIINIRRPEQPALEKRDSVAPGSGTQADPYSVASAIAHLGKEGYKDVYVRGYIVGSVTGEDVATDARFTAVGASGINILIADYPDEQGLTRVMPVQLPYGAVRSGLNLAGNPSNLGRRVTLRGDIGLYLGVAALRSTSAFTLD